MGMLTWEAEEARQERSAAMYEPGGAMHTGGSQQKSLVKSPQRQPATESTTSTWVNPNATTTSSNIKAQVSPSTSFAMDAGDTSGVRVDTGRFRTPRAAEEAAVRIRQYPPDLGLNSESSHYMMFSTYTVRGGVGSGTSDINFDGPHDYVALPIPGPPSATYEQGWDQKDVGAAGVGLQMAGQAGLNASQGVPGSSIAAQAQSNAESAIDALMTTGKSALGDARGIVGTVGKLIGQEAAAQRISGRASFQNTYVTYTGPAFRTFNYTFSMKPMSAAETYTCRDIVRFFKMNSAPTQKAGGIWRIYELPKVFQIKFYDRGGESEFVNRIGKCACTSVAVAYGGDRYTTFQNNLGPVQIDLTLAFKEIQLLDSKDMASQGAGF